MIALITPTGARPQQFNMCALWMSRQTYTGQIVWLIVDDALPRTTDAIEEHFKTDWTIIKIYPEPTWTYGQNTQSRNIEVAINTLCTNYREADIEAIFIIEDDDYYKSNYIERMMCRMQGFKVIGEMNTVYYNVYYRTYFVNRNTSHVSLFQLAFRPEMLPLFKSCYNEKFIDFKFYEKLHAQLYVHRGEVGFFNENNLAIGMKGMPGRAGIGAGHGKLLNMHPDPAMTYLLTQMNNEDAKYYAGYYGNNGYPQHLQSNRGHI
jgi:hypothetical protein